MRKGTNGAPGRENARVGTQGASPPRAGVAEVEDAGISRVGARRPRETESAERLQAGPDAHGPGVPLRLWKEVARPRLSLRPLIARYTPRRVAASESRECSSMTSRIFLARSFGR